MIRRGSDTTNKWFSGPAAVAVVVFSLILAGALVFNLTKINAQIDSIIVIEMKIEKARSELIRLESGAVAERDVVVAATLAEIAAFKALLPDRLGLTSVISDIMTAAARSGLIVRTGDYNPEIVKEHDISSYIISLPIAGSYPGLRRFIHDVETQGNHLSVDDITIVGSRSGDTDLDMKIKFSAYFLETEEAGAPEANPI